MASAVREAVTCLTSSTPGQALLARGGGGKGAAETQKQGSSVWVQKHKVGKGKRGGGQGAGC